MATQKKGSFPALYSCALDTILPCLGEDVFYRPRKGGSFEIKGIFDTQFVQVDPDTEEVVASNVPRVGIKLADIPFAPEQGDVLEIRNKRYKITDAQEDGLGGVSLLLHRVD